MIKKFHLHSLEIAQFSLACWIAWRNQKSKYWLTNAILNCNWLVENQKNNGCWLMRHKIQDTEIWKMNGVLLFARH